MQPTQRGELFVQLAISPALAWGCDRRRRTDDRSSDPPCHRASRPAYRACGKACRQAGENTERGIRSQ